MTERKWTEEYVVQPSDFDIDERHLDLYYCDLSSYMHLKPPTVSPNTTILRIYKMFRGLGIRHLPVIDEYLGTISGIITTKELLEHNLEDVVERVHDELDSSENTETFEKRLEFLKGKALKNEYSANYNEYTRRVSKWTHGSPISNAGRGNFINISPQISQQMQNAQLNESMGGYSNISSQQTSNANTMEIHSNINDNDNENYNDSNNNNNSNLIPQQQKQQPLKKLTETDDLDNDESE